MRVNGLNWYKMNIKPRNESISELFGREKRENIFITEANQKTEGKTRITLRKPSGMLKIKNK